MTPNRVDVLASTKEYLIRAVTEAKAVLRETTNQCARLWAHLAARLRLRSLKREFTTIRLWLASDMAETGVGDERLRQQIAILDERIKSIMAANGSTLLDETFTSTSQAESYFTNDALQLGALSGFGAGPISLEISLTETTTAANSGLFGHFLLGVTHE